LSRERSHTGFKKIILEPGNPEAIFLNPGADPSLVVGEKSVSLRSGFESGLILSKTERPRGSVSVKTNGPTSYGFAKICGSRSRLGCALPSRGRGWLKLDRKWL
jgi:hypothetical protein